MNALLCDLKLKLDDHVLRLGESEWHTVAELRTVAAEEFAPPNAYERDLKQLRAAATLLSRFEDAHRADRPRDVTATRTALDAKVATVPG